MPHRAPTPSLRPRLLSRRLAPLTAAVLLAHWALLSAAPLAVAPLSGLAAAGPTFTTRTIAAPDAEPPVVQLPPTTTPTAPRAYRTALPRPVRARSAATNSEPNPAAAPVPTAQPAIINIASDTQAVLLAAASAPATVVELPTATAPAVAPAGSPKASAAAAVAHNLVFPAPVRLKYDIKGESKGIPYYASAELLWQHDGHGYDARMEVSILMFSRTQTSTGQLTSQGLQPTRFGDKVRSEVAAHFERAKDKVSFSANTPDVPLLPGAQDQLSVFMQLAAMLGGAPGQFPKGTVLPFQAIGPRSSENWVFAVEATEKVDLPGGELSAVKLTREPAVEYGPRAEIWLAPELGYMPVRIRLTQANGDLVDQRWRATEKP